MLFSPIMRARLLIPITLLLAGCTSVPQQPVGNSPTITAFKPATPLSVELRRDQLVGWWYGDQATKENGRIQWIMRRSADGSFRITFRTTFFDGRVAEQTEIGDWGVNAQFLVTRTRGWLENGLVVEASRSDAYFWDVYEVTEIAADHIEYRSVQSQNRYHVRKVPVGFEFPQ